MQEYIKRILAKRLILALISKGECTFEELKNITGIPDDELTTLMAMIHHFYDELDTENGYIYKANDTAYTLPTIGDDFWRTLPRFDHIKMFEKEADILEHGDPLDFLVNAIGMLHKGDKEIIALNMLIGITPWMSSEQLHIYPVGISGKGKSDLCASTLSVFPQSCYEVVTTSSPKSIIYAYASGVLQGNKIIFFDDIKSFQEFVDVIKSFTGSSKVKTRHWTVDINRRFMDVRPEANYSIWLTSVVPVVDDQLKNRFIIANVDETLEQDARVYDHIDSIYRLNNEKKVLYQDIFVTCKNMMNILIQEPHGVIIPFKISFPLKFDRRAYIFFLILLKTIAFVYKFQRKKVANCIIATKTDFEIASRIYNKVQAFQTTKLEQSALTVLNIMPTNAEEAMSRAQLAEKLNIGTSDVTQMCNALLRAGFVNQEKRGTWVYWKRDDPRLDFLNHPIDAIEVTEKDLNEIGIPVELKDEINGISKLSVFQTLEEVKIAEPEKKEQTTLEEVIKYESEAD